MGLNVLTLVLNGMPWIASQWANLVASRVDFHWHVVEGTAAPTHCTSWCKPIEPQYSKDGTREFLDSLRNSPHVTVYRKPMWDGKVTMCNTALANIKESGILLQMDSDEIWTPQQLARLSRLFADKRSHAYFWCRYFFGPDIVMTTRNCYANNPKQEWKRAWWFEPGMKFTTHEPPVLDGEKQDAIMHDDTEKAGFVFDHFGYALEKQVAFKEAYYGYTNAVAEWRRLQANENWPARLCDYLGWVKDESCLTSRI